MPPKISIIILNWNQPEFTVNCVKSVLKQSYQDFEILLVDNGSEDNSLEIFKREFGRNGKIRILETGKNLGYAGGNNFGVVHTKGEFVVILNNDTIVEGGWLHWLSKGIETKDGVGAVSSMEIREGRKVDSDYSDVNIALSILGRYIRTQRSKKLKESDLVDFLGIKGLSFIYKKNIVELPFDSEYFIYAEDTYLGWLLSMKGYKNKLSKRSIVHHLHNVSKKSNKKINKHFIYLGERNLLINFFIFYEFNNLLKIFPLMVMRIPLLNIFEPRKIPYRLKSYMWILTNYKKLLEKRKHIQKQRKVKDKELISRMSCKFYEDEKIENPISRFILKSINYISYLYCKLFGLNTLEVMDSSRITTLPTQARCN